MLLRVPLLIAWLGGTSPSISYALAPSPSNSNTRRPNFDLPSVLSSWASAACLATTLAIGQPIHSCSAADELVANPKAIVIDGDVRSILKTVVSNRRALKETLGQIVGPVEKSINVFGSSVVVKPPSDIQGAVRDALAGEVSAIVDGQKVEIVVRTAEGGLAVFVQGPIIPKLPLLKPLSTDEYVVKSMSDGSLDFNIAADVKAMLNRAVEAEKKSVSQFWDQEFLSNLGGRFFGITNKNVAGGSSLAIGASYGVAYYHHTALQKKGPAAAKQKREAADTQKKATAKVAPVKDKISKDSKAKTEDKIKATKDTQTPAEAANGEKKDAKDTPEIKKTGGTATAKELKAEKAARAAVEAAKFAKVPKSPKEVSAGSDKSNTLPTDNAETEEPALGKKRRWWKFWRWLS